MGLIKFSETILIEETAERVFDFTQDYSERLNWDTFLKKAELIDGATVAAPGVKAYCMAKNGMGMVTEYITFNRPNVTAIKMTKGPYLFKSFLGSWIFKKFDQKHIEVTFLYSFSLRFPFNLLSGLIRNNLVCNVKQRLIDLKQNVERNEGINH